MSEGDSRVADELEESFKLLKHLGRGGFADTWQAQVLDQELIEEFGRDEVALKIPLNRKKEQVLKRELAMNAALHLRLKDLQSRNLVRYLGFDKFRNKIVMVMEYVGQGSLRRMTGEIGRQKPLPVDEAVEIAEGILSGLMVIHQEHVFHRDIKPENILMDGRTPKIADLGIARMLDANELASTSIGSLPYMSPEILGKEGASFTSDIWSLGVTFYEMLTGSLPFGDMDTPPGSLIDLIRDAEPVPPAEVSTEIPTALNEIVMRALRKRASERFPSAEEMYEALKRFREASRSQVDQDIASIRELLSRPGDPCEAEERLRELVAKYPNDPRGRQYLGEFYNRCQRYEEAIATFKRGIELEPENALLHWDLALAYRGAGKRGAAAGCLEKAIALGLDAGLGRHAATLLRTLQGAEP
ncbi:MAG: hypothetical protein A2Y61_02855 [Chloroflexi bacterium RBG_13_60_13]|nr:MAG: hypothetical protein A2Y61_02855 [Chloroflexi bacterium RBG_13_60_13]